MSHTPRFTLPHRSGAIGWLQVLIGLSLIWTLASCASGDPTVRLKGQSFSVEVVTTPEDQSLGLMFREQMDADHGMLFVNTLEAPRAFWMKNTRIPLDILYFDSQLKLVSAQFDVPPCKSDPCPNYPSEGPAQYILELNGGVARQMGVTQGDLLQIDYGSSNQP